MSTPDAGTTRSSTTHCLRNGYHQFIIRNFSITAGAGVPFPTPKVCVACAKDLSQERPGATEKFTAEKGTVHVTIRAYLCSECSASREAGDFFQCCLFDPDSVATGVLLDQVLTVQVAHPDVAEKWNQALAAFVQMASKATDLVGEKIGIPGYAIGVTPFFDRQQFSTSDANWRDPLSNRGKREACFIATACYGSYDHPDVHELRSFRDGWLTKSSCGLRCVDLYYRFSPALARFLGRRRFLRWGVRVLILMPAVRLLRYCHDAGNA